MNKHSVSRQSFKQAYLHCWPPLFPKAREVDIYPFVHSFVGQMISQDRTIVTWMLPNRVPAMVWKKWPEGNVSSSLVRLEPEAIPWGQVEERSGAIKRAPFLDSSTLHYGVHYCKMQWLLSVWTTSMSSTKLMAEKAINGLSELVPIRCWGNYFFRLQHLPARMKTSGHCGPKK